jgi:hypothetical protein
VFALGAAVLYNLWFFVLRPGPRATGRTAPEQPILDIGALSPGTSAQADPTKIPAPPDVDIHTRPAWARDPFLFGDESRTRTAAGVRQSPGRELMVRSILFSSSRRLAIVNGHIVGVGDTVGTYTVSDIEQGAVVFATSTGERRRVTVHAPAPRGLVQ